MRNCINYKKFMKLNVTNIELLNNILSLNDNVFLWYKTNMHERM